VSGKSEQALKCCTLSDASQPTGTEIQDPGGQAVIDRSRQGTGFAPGLVFVLATWGLYFCVLWPRMLFERSDGLYAGWRTVWADWAVHLSYANVFAYWPIGDWFSSNPVFATADFAYPFLADAVSGLLMRAGMELVSAFVLPSIVASLALVSLLFLFYALLLGSSRAAVLASTLFFTNGGAGFLQFAADLAREPSLRLLRLPPREYTYLPEHGIQWINVVSSEILPQRALLLGVPLALLVLISAWRWRQRGFENVSNAKLAGLGVLASLLVITHAHSYLALVLFCGMLFLFDLSHYRRWLVFAAAAALSSLVLLALFYDQASTARFIRWQPGWLANPTHGGHGPLWLFLWLNWGVFLPIAAVSIIRFRYYRDPLVLGAVLLFIACFLFRFQPHAWDNTKLLTWAHLLLCIPVARYLQHLWSKRRAISRCLAVVLFLFTTASGFLEVWRLTRTSEIAVRMWSSQEIALAEAFRSVSAPLSLVLTSDHHHNWVTPLSGRPVLLGYRGWLASYGIDYSTVERDVRTMLQGGPRAAELLERYGVEFAAIGRSERRDFGAAEGYFRRHHQLILEEADYSVFEIRGSAGRERPGEAGEAGK
jgi:hypothetical protein